MNIAYAIYAILAATATINIIGPLQGMSERRWGIDEGLPAVMTVQKGTPGWMVRMVALAVALEAILPALMFAWLVKYLPFGGVRAGISFGAALFVLGALPPLLFEPLLIKVPSRFVAHNVAWAMLKHLAIGTVIGVVYRI